MGIGPIASTKSGHGVQDYFEGRRTIDPNNSHQNFRPGRENIVESNFTLVGVASAFGTGALLAHNTGKVIPVGPRLVAIETMHRETMHEKLHEKLHQNVTDGMGVAAGAALVAAGLIAFAKSCIAVAGGVAAGALLMTKQALDAARPTTATPDL